MFRTLTVAMLGTALAGCVQMQVNNAQVFADQASRIAESCPAAAEGAAAAQQAADRAAAAAESLANYASAAEAQRSQAEYWEQRAEEHAARAEARDREAERLRSERGAALARLEAASQACVRAADPACFGLLAGAPGSIVCEDPESQMRACGCSDQRSCEAARDAARARQEAGMSDLDRQIAEAEEGARQARTLATSARQEAQNYSSNARYYEDQASYQSTVVAGEERNAQEAAEAAAEACDESLFSEAPPPDGTYSQDVFGSQNQGLGSVLGTASGACSPAMQSSCAAIQVFCNVSCGPPGAPTSCSPGAPPGCLACFAAGCI